MKPSDLVEVRREVTPRWPVRLPRGNAPDGVLRCRNGVVERYLHVEGAPAIVRAAQPAKDRVVIGAWAGDAATAEEAIARMRFALGVDDDFRDFYERFRFDALIGPSVRARPWLRVFRRPEPFEALAWAVTEQLIDYPRAAAIQRAMVRTLGARCPRTGLRDAPSAARVAGTAPALLESMDLKGSRAIALVRAAREVASGRVDLRDPDHERGWRRLRKISGIGSWTQEILAVHGQGRYDQIPAGDLGFVKLVGYLRSGGDPRVRATEDEVREFFAPYEGWAGLAGAHALRSPLQAAGR
ncbi:MAG: DNA-3-methyladenine glycosylase 2 family protein, partial [Solirubrobacterales bacterium]|nr:DNA-3-methyladenine glycosylase 2 family protein [Solirubrobacterales bacterium]